MVLVRLGSSVKGSIGLSYYSSDICYEDDVLFGLIVIDRQVRGREII
jgi:hypothetical protein